MVDGKHLALHDHRAHVHAQILHGNGGALEGLAVEGLAGSGRGGRLFLPLRGGSSRQILHHLAPHGFHGFKQGLSLQRRAGLNGNGHRHREPLPQHLLHGRHLLHQGILAVGGKTDGQLLPLPVPFRSRQGTPGHGIPLNEQVHQFFRLDFCQLVSWVGSCQRHAPQAIEGGNLLRRLIQQPLGDVGFAVDNHMNTAFFRRNVRSGDSRLTQRCVQRLRRLIVGKHLK